MTRNRRGDHGCVGQRLPADALERGLIDSLLQTFNKTDLVDQAVQLAAEATRQTRSVAAERLAGVESELANTRQALDRYFVAFESARLSEEAAAPRIEALSARMRELTVAREELEAAKEAEDAIVAPSAEDLDAVRGQLPQLLGEGNSRAAKALLRELVAEVRVESRASILPIFKLPARGVRLLHRMVDPRCRHENSVDAFDGIPYEVVTDN